MDRETKKKEVREFLEKNNLKLHWVYKGEAGLEKFIDLLERHNWLCPCNHSRGECPKNPKCLETIKKTGVCGCSIFYTPERWEWEQEVIAEAKKRKKKKNLIKK